MGKKIAPKGSSEAFVRQALSSNTDECIVWPYRTNDRGYGLAVIGGRQRAASNWVCRLAHGDPQPPRTHAAHHCGNPACVNPIHIRWATPKENSRDRRKHGTENVGENSGRTTLTEADVRYIRAAPPKLKPLMERFGMSKHGISKIRSGSRWGHVK